MINHTFVQFPFYLQLLGFGVFTARKLHSDFKTIGMDIIKIFHSTRYIVPGRAVSDSPGKVVAFKGQLISKCLYTKFSRISDLASKKRSNQKNKGTN
jgi:hypothetical protein